MTIGSLFAGIGGLDLGLEAAGLGPVVWQVEIDPFCRAVLAKHWPGADRSVSDVRLASASTLPHVDVVCGGFPCQDVSAAGKRAGLSGERSGLWYEYKRIVGELRPRIVVVENVASGAKSWLCPVRSDLHELGYDTTALAIGAEDVGAPHRRSRIFVVGFVVADSHGSGQRQPGRALADIGRRPRDRRETVADTDSAEPLGDSHSAGRTARCRMGRQAGPAAHRASGMGDTEGERRPERRAEPAREQGRLGAIGSSLGDALARVGRGADGLPARLDGHRWPAGRGPDQHDWEPSRTVTPRTVKDRVARVKALGNAVVPHCALVVGRWIAEARP